MAGSTLTSIGSNRLEPNLIERKLPDKEFVLSLL